VRLQPPCQSLRAVIPPMTATSGPQVTHRRMKYVPGRSVSTAVRRPWRRMLCGRDLIAAPPPPHRPSRRAPFASPSQPLLRGCGAAPRSLAPAGTARRPAIHDLKQGAGLEPSLGTLPRQRRPGRPRDRRGANDLETSGADGARRFTAPRSPTRARRPTHQTPRRYDASSASHASESSCSTSGFM
jgi:hypothetical protein